MTEKGSCIGRQEQGNRWKLLSQNCERHVSYNWPVVTASGMQNGILEKDAIQQLQWLFMCDELRRMPEEKYNRHLHIAFISLATFFVQGVGIWESPMPIPVHIS